jgi:hypothetical protein
MDRVEIGRRRSHLDPPPHVVFEGLTQPHRQQTRQWLLLLEDEQEPAILEQDPPHRLVWSSFWPHHPTARVTVELERELDSTGSFLCWSLDVDAPGPDPRAVGHLRQRMNKLLNSHLRDYFDL